MLVTVHGDDDQSVTAEEGTQALGDKATGEGGGILQHRLDVVVLEDRIGRVTVTLTGVGRYRQTGHEVAFHNRRGLTLLATYGVKIDIQATVVFGQGRKGLLKFFGSVLGCHRVSPSVLSVPVSGSPAIWRFFI